MNWFTFAHTQLHDPVFPLESRTVFRSDIVGAKQLARSRSENELSAMLDKHAALVEEAIYGTRGKLVGRDGDAVVVDFDPTDATQAVQTAIRIQERAIRDLHQQGIKVTQGIATGEVIFTAGRFVGPISVLAHSLSLVAAANAIFIDVETTSRTIWSSITSEVGQRVNRIPSDYLAAQGSYRLRDFKFEKEAREVVWSDQAFGTKPGPNA